MLLTANLLSTPPRFYYLFSLEFIPEYCVYIISTAPSPSNSSHVLPPPSQIHALFYYYITHTCLWSHMYMCLDMITWDWISYQGGHCWRRSILSQHPLSTALSVPRGETFREFFPIRFYMSTGGVIVQLVRQLYC